MLQTINDYQSFLLKLEKIPENEKTQITRHLCRTDLFFLLWFACGRKDMASQWLIDRCKEVQDDPDGYVDLWAREHYKSTIITYGKTIQDILASHGDDPLPKWNGLEPTFGIFSHTRPIAKGFLRQIKREFEGNTLLLRLFPDVIWELPHKDAPKWSEDDGLILKRKSNPKESTVEAWGLVEGQPTSKHFNVLVYDDVVTQDSVYTPGMMAKTISAWELSINLGTRDVKRRHIGTRYHFNDAYRLILSRDVKPREYPAQEGGRIDGLPAFKTKEELANLRKLMGPYTYSCQMLLNPIADETQGFKKDWILFHKGSTGAGTNKYILVDPANDKKKTSDYTAIFVVGLGADENYYILDMVRDRLNLTQRGDVVFRLHQKWKPILVGYEKYGMQADVTYLKERMSRENYHFALKELGGQLSKNDRVRKLIPLFEQGRMYFPESCFKTNYEGKTEELVDIFIHEEYTAFPVSVHDDMIDCLARIVDPELGTVWPRLHEKRAERYSGKRTQTSAWAS